MGRLKSVLTRVELSGLKRMYQNALLVHKESHKSVVYILFDMAICIIKYNIGYMEYRLYHLIDKDDATRKTYFTYSHNVACKKLFNKPEVLYLLDDKIAFNNLYKDFLGREFFDPNKQDFEEFKKYVGKKKQIFVKPADSFGGTGIYKKIDIDKNTDLKEVYQFIIDNRLYSEDVIVQCDKMSSLHPSSINTVRIVTLVVDGKANFMYAILRMGKDGSKVDNICSGGLYARLSNDGEIVNPCYCDKTCEYYTVHPTTGIKLIGFKVPKFKQAVDFCLKAAELEPRLGYVGWDVSITDKGPVFVEGNNTPGSDMPQNHIVSGKATGMLPDFEKVIGHKIF